MEKQYTPKKAKASQLSKDLVQTSSEKKVEKKEAIKPSKPITPDSSSPAQVTSATPSTTPSTENKPEQKTEQKTSNKKIPKEKKEEAIAKGLNLHASKKHCMYISSFIKNKPIDLALAELEKVIAIKRPIPFKGEIPHRSYPGMMSGRYPVNASKQFIYLLKALKGNAIANGLELEKTRISFASANWASRPQKRGGMRFKRTHVVLKAREFSQKEKANKQKTESKQEIKK